MRAWNHPGQSGIRGRPVVWTIVGVNANLLQVGPEHTCPTALDSVGALWFDKADGAVGACAQAILSIVAALAAIAVVGRARNAGTVSPARFP